MKSELLTQAELSLGERLTVANAPAFFASWASALADGSYDGVLDALAETEIASAPPEPPEPAGNIPYNSGRCGGKPQPARWVLWNDAVRKSFLDRQVTYAAFKTALSVPEAAHKLGVTPWVLYTLADPRRGGSSTPKAFVRHGCSMGVDEKRLDELKKLVS